MGQPLLTSLASSGRSTTRSAAAGSATWSSLVVVAGARPVDLLRKLNETQPQVVHFSSHGSPDEILLEAEGGERDEAADRLGATTRSDSERDMKLRSAAMRPDVAGAMTRGIRSLSQIGPRGRACAPATRETFAWWCSTPATPVRRPSR